MAKTMSGADDGKRAAARLALEAVSDGMALGLGSGSTAEAFIRVLGERVAQGLRVCCAATSKRTAELAESCGIALRSLDDFTRLDLTIDGADEIDPALNLIKGGGGCHLVEKIVAGASDAMLVIADETKIVATLGAFPLPVEITPWGWRTTDRAVRALLQEADVATVEGAVRMAGDSPLRTDEGNLIVDYALGRIGDPAALSCALNRIPGVVENGLFVGMAQRAAIGDARGGARIVTPQGGA